MDWSPLLISSKNRFRINTDYLFRGLLLACWVVSLRLAKAKIVIDGLLTLPLVLPPTVMASFCCLSSGRSCPVGQFLPEVLGIKIVFSWPATVIAAVVISAADVPFGPRGLLSRWIPI